LDGRSIGGERYPCSGNLERLGNRVNVSTSVVKNDYGW
jgi:hypothetical protein